LKNPHLLRCAHHSSLRRTNKYDSFLMISCALHLGVFEQPQEKDFFNTPSNGVLLYFFIDVQSFYKYSSPLKHQYKHNAC
jgi:hypothetical protein